MFLLEVFPCTRPRDDQPNQADYEFYENPITFAQRNVHERGKGGLVTCESIKVIVVEITDCRVGSELLPRNENRLGDQSSIPIAGAIPSLLSSTETRSVAKFDVE